MYKELSSLCIILYGGFCMIFQGGYEAQFRTPHKQRIQG